MRITQTILVTAIGTPDRDACFPEGIATGSWSVGIVEQSQGEVCCWLWGVGPRGHEEGDCGGKCLWRKIRQPWRQADTPEACVGVAPSRKPLSPHACTSSWATERLAHQTPDAQTTEKGPNQGSPFSALRTEHQSRTPVNGAPLCAWHTEQQSTPGRGALQVPEWAEQCRSISQRGLPIASHQRLEKDSESPLNCKEIQPVHPTENQSWIFIGRTDAKAETPILWPPDAKNWLIGKDPDTWKDWRLKEKGGTEDEIAGRYHQLNGREFE